MQKPLIGITTRNGQDADGHPISAVQHAYINAIRNAGGLPILIPSILEEDALGALYSLLAGILFTGGGDISLEHFRGEDHPRIEGVDVKRDLTEIFLVRAAAREGKPMLGICRGAQVMNVALGGTLYTHLYDQVPNALDHAYPGSLRRSLVHPVNVDEESRAAEIFGETFLRVNSLHHQALKDVAAPLRVVGRAPDGVAEVVEMPEHPYAVAVQWHPEWLTDQPAMLRLFQSLIDAAAK
ncbi:MAG: gamma-glutamyl-gamma-aminobutyrate hydrolase family protein [Anaerolineales bacterium]